MVMMFLIKIQVTKLRCKNPDSCGNAPPKAGLAGSPIDFFLGGSGYPGTHILISNDEGIRISVSR